MPDMTDQELFAQAPRRRDGAFDMRSALGQQAFERENELREQEELDRELLNSIEDYSSHSYGSGTSDNGELSRQRSLALDAYAGKMLDVPPEGRSKVNDRTVFETIQWIMPSMMRIFAGGENIVEFDPVGPEDEDIAEQESNYLNYMVTQRNDWDLTVREWCQDGLTTKNAYCLVDMEEKIVPEVETYMGQSEDQVAMLVEDDMEIIGHNQYDDPDDEGTLIHPASGQPVQDEAQMMEALALYQAAGIEPQLQFRQMFDVQVRRATPKQQLRFEVLPPEHCKVGRDTPDFTLEDCNYFEFWDPDCTISEVRKMGYDIPDDIEGTDFEWTDEDSSRNEPLEEDTHVDSRDPAMKRVTLRTVWIRHDYDKDGIAELQKVVLVGRKIVDHEPASRIPVASIVPYINTHRHMGWSIADLVFDIQRIKTKLWRSGLDGIELALHPQHAISKKVSVDDMLVSRSGGIKRVKTDLADVAGHIVPLPTQNTFPDAMQGLEHADRVVESRVGVNKMFQGIDSSNLNDHNRVGQLSTMAAQRVEDIARLFGNGFKRLFSLAHEALIKAGSQQEQIRLNGQWQDVDPTQWRTGRDMRVVAPFAAGNKDSLVQRLMIHMSIHEKALAAGAPFVQLDDAYELSKMLADATDVPASKIYTDPATIEPPPPPPDYQRMQLEVANKEVDNRAANDEMDAENKRLEIEADVEIKKYTVDKNQETQLMVAAMKGDQQQGLEQTKANLKNSPIELGNEAIRQNNEMIAVMNETVADSIRQVKDALSELRAEAEAPVKIVKRNGNIVGKEVNGKFIPLEVVNDS